MDWRERAIHERFEQQTCSQCGSPYPADAGVVVAHRGTVYILLATCDSCQHRALFLVSFPHHRTTGSSSSAQTLASAALPSPATASSPAIFPTAARAAVTTADVDEVRRFLDTFDGDFRRLFGER